MKKREGVRVYKQTVVNAVILAVIIALFLYLAIQLTSGFSLQVSTQRTQKITDSKYVHLEGYIFRNDEVLASDADVVYYAVGDGEKVGVDQLYAEIFTQTGLSKDAMADKQSKINDLSERISLLQGGLGGNTLSDLGSVKDEIYRSYYAYVDSILNGDFSQAGKVGDILLSSMVDYSAITGGDATKDKLSSLKSQRDQLLDSIGGTRRTLTSDRSFTFFYSADGYENIFHTSKLEGLTRKGLDELISQEPVSASGTVGKMTYTSKWHLAIPIDEASYETFKGKVGSTLSVSFSDTDGLVLDMLLERVYADEEDPDSAYMLLSSFDLAHVAFLNRAQNVSILLSELTGYKIPEDAIHTKDGQEGVYVLVGNVIEFRRVTKIGQGDGYFIVNTFEADALEDPTSEIPYLNINDMIVTSGNDLYDGKQLD